MNYYILCLYNVNCSLTFMMKDDLFLINASLSEYGCCSCVMCLVRSQMSAW